MNWQTFVAGVEKYGLAHWSYLTLAFVCLVIGAWIGHHI